MPFSFRASGFNHWSSVGGDFCPIRDIWQFLEMFLVDTSRPGAPLACTGERPGSF